jgi:crotonobetainyl-CoA:carnitine CoA-transferase CaiB-like acyl-CoA transferase
LAGAFGAEIIKIEWPENLDILRSNRMVIPPGVEPGPNAPGQFADTNVNKRGMTLNVRTPKGLEIARRLAALSDIVMENFSSRVMQKWGLGYEDLKKLRPDIIYVSMAGFGHTGRNHHYTTMGPSAQALSGQTFLSGLPGKPPAGWGWSYLDDTGGMYGVMGALTALRHRHATGQGQHVDLSQMTMGITLTGAAFLDRTVNGRPARREGYPPGNRTVWPGAPLVNNYRGPTVAPHNTYRTQGRGDNDWCVIACFSDQEWQNLVGVMGSPAWATDARFNTLQGRIQHQEALDQGIEQWAPDAGEIRPDGQVPGHRGTGHGRTKPGGPCGTRSATARRGASIQGWNTHSWDGTRSRVFPSNCRKHPPRSPGQRRSSASIHVRCSPSCWG